MRITRFLVPVAALALAACARSLPRDVEARLNAYRIIAAGIPGGTPREEVLYHLGVKGPYIIGSYGGCDVGEAVVADNVACHLSFVTATGLLAFPIKVSRCNGSPPTFTYIEDNELEQPP